MTSQRDETTSRPAGEDVADDPIVIERRDEILTGEEPTPAGVGESDDPAASGTSGYDRGAGAALGFERPGFERPGFERAGDERAGDEQAGPEATGEGGPASDELAGRHAVPDTGGMDPAPLVIPADPASPESASPELASPESASPELASPESASPELASPEAGRPGTGTPGSDSPTAYDPATSGPAAMPGSAAPGPGPFATPVSDQAEPPSAAPSTPVTVAEPGVAQPGVAGIPEPDVSGPAGAGDAAGAGIPAAALSEQQWPAIQAMFVDDPKGSVQRAAAAADEVVKACVASIGREQAALRTAWENDATTEDLRTALQQYRAFCNRIESTMP